MYCVLGVRVGVVFSAMLVGIKTGHDAYYDAGLGLNVTGKRN